jgi:hypothetical protein
MLALVTARRDAPGLTVFPQSAEIVQTLMMWQKYHFPSLQTSVDGFQNCSCLRHCHLQLQRQIVIIEFILPPLLERFTVYVMRHLSSLSFKLINTKIPHSISNYNVS